FDVGQLVPNGLLILDATGSGAGDGGKVAITTTNGGISVGVGSSLEIFASGGSAGSLAGSGGTIKLTASGDVSINSDPLGITFGSLADTTLGTANGGSLLVSAGGAVRVNGNLDASGIGGGVGGVISLSAGGSISVGSITANGGGIIGLDAGK